MGGMADDSEPRRSPIAEGIAAARARGVRIGRPPAPPPASAGRAAQLRDEGKSLAQIAAALDAESVPTPSGRGSWSRASVQYALARWDKEQAGDDTTP